MDDWQERARETIAREMAEAADVRAEEIANEISAIVQSGMSIASHDLVACCADIARSFISKNPDHDAYSKKLNEHQLDEAAIRADEREKIASEFDAQAAKTNDEGGNPSRWQQAADFLRTPKKPASREAVLEQALRDVANWRLPPAEFKGEPCSFESAYGSNGARDWMRKIARHALEWKS